MLITTKRPHRRPDPVLMLLLFVAIGMCATLGYQISLYSGDLDAPIATQMPPPAGLGG